MPSTFRTIFPLSASSQPHVEPGFTASVVLSCVPAVLNTPPVRKVLHVDFASPFTAEVRPGVGGQGKGGVQSPQGGSSLVVKWLTLSAPDAGGLGSIPGQGT